MKKETKKLLNKSINSLILGMEHFNRPSDVGRIESVLVFLDHSFEMLLKSCLLQKGGRIFDRRSNQTIGLDECVRKAVSEEPLKFLNEDQALVIQVINSLRDAAQHYLLEISEQQLYLHAQSAISLFADILSTVFKMNLSDHISNRVLPISANPPKDLSLIVENELEVVKELLRPRTRKRIDAQAKLRPFVIMEKALKGEQLQPSLSEMKNTIEKLEQNKSWKEVFPAIASLKVDQEGKGIPFNLQITKSKGTPIYLVPKGTPDAFAVAIMKTDSTGYYSLSLNAIAKKVGLTPNKTLAIILYLNLQSDKNYFKEFNFGSTRIKRYSIKVVERINIELQGLNLSNVWKWYLDRQKKQMV